MPPTQQDIQTLAYFEVIDRNRRGAGVDEILSQLAQGADRSMMTKSTLWHGWLANVGGGQYALTLRGYEVLDLAVQQMRLNGEVR